MKPSDILKLALLNLSRHKSRTLLAILGVIVGTASIILMLSIGYSGYRQLATLLENDAHLTRIEISDYSGDAHGGITDDVISWIASLDHVAAVSGVVELPAILETGAYTASTTILGVSPDVLDLDFEQGGMYQPGNASPMLIAGKQALKQFVDPAHPLDYADWESYEKYEPDVDWNEARIRMRFGYADQDEEDSPDAPFGTEHFATVAGILRGADSMDTDRIYMDLEVAKEILAENRELARSMGIPLSACRHVLVRADDAAHVQNILEQVSHLGYDAYSEATYISQLREQLSRQQAQLLSTGLITLCVSAIGIANTMHASVLERKRSIGVMKVLGMSGRKIRTLFLTEAALIGILGGVAGLVVSWILTLAINSGTAQVSFLGVELANGTQITIPAWVAIGAVGVALLTGLASGIHPARKATGMSPLEAMRGAD